MNGLHPRRRISALVSAVALLGPRWVGKASGALEAAGARPAFDLYLECSGN